MIKKVEALAAVKKDTWVFYYHKNRCNLTGVSLNGTMLKCRAINMEQCVKYPLVAKLEVFVLPNENEIIFAPDVIQEEMS